MDATQPLTLPGLHRRIKRHLYAQDQAFFANCAVGLEPFLEAELRSLDGVKPLNTWPGGLEFTGPFEAMYQANLRLRTAGKVLLRIDSFVAKSYPELHNKCLRVPWERYVGFVKKVSFDVTAKQSRLHHAGNVESAVFDAVAKVMVRQGVEVVNDDSAPVRFFVRLADDECTLSADTSGELLHRRGYREATAKAPLRENIAAALLMACHWRRFPVIADPLCGSGTFAIEAALMAANRAPGSRRSFAFVHWPSFQEAHWRRLLARAGQEQPVAPPLRVVAADIAAGAIGATKGNAARAGVGGAVEARVSDCRGFNADGSLGSQGLIISNLPYGKRVGDLRQARDLCRDFGARLRTSCRGWRFGLVVPDASFAKQLGLRVESELSFSNGGLPVVFLMGAV